VRFIEKLHGRPRTYHWTGPRSPRQIRASKRAIPQRKCGAIMVPEVRPVVSLAMSPNVPPGGCFVCSPSCRSTANASMAGSHSLSSAASGWCHRAPDGWQGHTVNIASLLCRLDARYWSSSGSLVTTRACRRSAVTTTSASMMSEVPVRPQMAQAALPRFSVSGVTWQALLVQRPQAAVAPFAGHQRAGVVDDP
jgi:hypothetical protein